MGRFLAWLIESSLLIMMVFGIRRLFTGKIPYVAVYALWLVVLVRFLIPVNFISTPVSVSNFISEVLPVEETAGAEPEVYEAESGTGNETVPVSQYSSGNDTENFAVKETLAAGDDTQEFSAQEVMTKGASAGEQYREGKPSGTKSGRGAGGADTSRFLCRLWLAGAVFLFLMVFLSNARLLCRLKKNRKFYGERENIKIYTVYDLKNPCLYGFFRPAIYIPKGLITSGKADEEDLKQMIAHEFVHYRHGDHIWAMLRMLLVSVYWFHPFLWLAALYSKKDAELFCDETTIRLLGEEKRFCYGEMLVRLAGNRAWGDFLYPMMPMSRRGKEMEQRIRAISRKKKYPKWLLFPMTVILLAAVSVTCSTGLDPLAREKKQASDEQGEKAVSGSAVDAVSEKTTAARGYENDRDTSVPSGAYVGWSPNFNQTADMIFQTGDYGDETKTLFFESEPAGGENQAVYAATPQEAFKNYIQIFTNAVNTGDITNMDHVLAVGSEAYEQQCALVANYHKRGIREEVKSVSAASLKEIDSSHVEICSKEKIRVFYADGSSKVIKQKYRYLCERFMAQSVYAQWPVWEITKMEALG
ncbi:MAG: M56 family metallopeptidase [Roseburia sp.]|nr:M56 family metallopeptidase [Roseburia sp.]